MTPDKIGQNVFVDGLIFFQEKWVHIKSAGIVEHIGLDSSLIRLKSVANNKQHSVIVKDKYINIIKVS